MRYGISYEIALRWIPLDLTDDKSTLVQVMAWCCQATSHYLSQCWPRSMLPNGVTRPQWVKILTLSYSWMMRRIHSSDKIHYHGCWWPGHAKSQHSSSIGIDLVIPEYSQSGPAQTLLPPPQWHTHTSSTPSYYTRHARLYNFHSVAAT